MNERFIITIPASVALWVLAVMLVTSGHKDAPRPMIGRDAVTVHLISEPAPAASVPSPPKMPEPKPEPVAIPRRILPGPIAHPVTAAKPAPAKYTQPPSAPAPKLSEAKNDHHGATVTYQPMPKIPDDLRREAFNTYATAQFHIAADGTATVDLTVPSQNPRLNHLLLESLKHWRFDPATDNGKPIASIFSIRVRFAVE